MRTTTFVLLLIFPMLSTAVQATDADSSVQAAEHLIQTHYAHRDRLATIHRVLGIDRRLGAYRAAASDAELVARVNADLRVASKDVDLRLMLKDTGEAARSAEQGGEVCRGRSNKPSRTPRIAYFDIDAHLRLAVPTCSPA
ncbi:N-terminal domain of Peptidase_S41 [Dyella sp. OK004]|uniref:hypothetical protein n=1 Tax=Dyella sp. OK004 TaxID=1855292 RepID=UPI0008E20898|nr:hypothetical protein [Dyella sp. OK004]SFS14617.1 N-terminal domain of Peptidase_S41 [Dyella sp. OK004]